MSSLTDLVQKFAQKAKNAPISRVMNNTAAAMVEDVCWISASHMLEKAIASQQVEREQLRDALHEIFDHICSVRKYTQGLSTAQRYSFSNSADADEIEQAIDKLREVVNGSALEGMK